MRRGMKAECLSHERNDSGVHRLLGREARDPHDHELRHVHLQRRVDLRDVEPLAEAAVAPCEEVQQLLREVLLKQAEQLHRRDEAFLEEHLPVGKAAGDGLLPALGRLLVGEASGGRQVTPERLVDQVRPAFHGHALLDDDGLPHRAPLEVEDEGALANGVGVQQHGERHVLERAFPEPGDLLELLGTGDHKGAILACDRADSQRILRMARSRRVYHSMRTRLT